MEEAIARYDSDHSFTTQDILWLHKFWLGEIFVASPGELGGVT